jgi:hypothetical protein
MLANLFDKNAALEKVEYLAAYSKFSLDFQII